MNNPRINKISEEIDKTKSKIAELQTKLRSLEKQKESLENEQIVALVRSRKISDAELELLMQSLKNDKNSGVPAQITIGTEVAMREDDTYN
jgi:predicted nuclease with TOPRIM domain